MRLLGIALVAGALGAGLGSLLSRRTVDASAPTTASRVVIAPTPAPRSCGLSDEDRELLRQASATPPVAEAPETPEPPKHDPQALTRALALVEQAETSGRWREEDREALHAALRDASPEETDQVMLRLTQDINAQRVRLD